jgi:hypothetical protein
MKTNASTTIFQYKDIKIILCRVNSMSRKKKSLCARAIVEKTIDMKIEEKQEREEKHHIGEYYWSASYADEYIVIAISKQKIGIDIEKLVERDNILLTISPLIKDWESFYIVWTGKEAVIKAYNLSLEDHEIINPTLITKNQSIFNINDNEVIVRSFSLHNHVITVCAI